MTQSNRNPGDRTFVRITQREIYDKLESLDLQLQSITKKLDYTNGKVKLTRWQAGLALTISLGIGATLISLTVL